MMMAERRLKVEPMAKTTMNGVQRAILSLFEVERLRAASDQDLVQRFALSRDEAAFRAIAERHGPMVHGLCLRALGCQHDAEDAFQATFLIFLQRAGSIRKSGSLASWLHGVARRVVNELQRNQRRRNRREQAASTAMSKTPVDELSWAEVKTCLDEELERLPVAYRETLVLCYLEGQTRDEAAKRLGVEVGVVKGRLERGRKMLAERLSKRGVTLSAGLLTLALSPGTVSAIVRAGSLFAAGESIAPLVTPGVLLLTNNVLKGMVMTKLKLIAAGLACSVMLVAGLVYGPAPGGAGPAAAAGTPLPVQKPEPREGTFVVGCTNNSKPGEVAALVALDGTARGFVAVGELKIVMNPRVSPDGKRLAFLWKGPYTGKPQDVARSRAILDLYVADIGGKDPPTEPIIKDVIYASIAWTPDSKQLYVSTLPEEQYINELAGQKVPFTGQIVAVRTRLFDLGTKKETPIDIPEGHGVCDVTADNKAVLTQKIMQYPSYRESITSYLVPLATLNPKAIADDEEGFDHARFSPDGKRVAGVRQQHTQSKEKGLFVYDIATERLTAVALSKEIPQEKLKQVAWAPDGKRLAVLWWVPAPEGSIAVGGPPGAPGVRADGHPIYRITSFDPNGENAKMVQEFKARPFDYMVWGFDWADLVRPAAAPRE
jgi:RNA polymerase sigma factor (sigma-70 family)